MSRPESEVDACPSCCHSLKGSPGAYAQYGTGTPSTGGAGYLLEIVSMRPCQSPHLHGEKPIKRLDMRAS